MHPFQQRLKHWAVGAACFAAAFAASSFVVLAVGAAFHFGVTRAVARRVAAVTRGGAALLCRG